MANCAICNKETEGSKYVLIRSHGVEAEQRRFLCLDHNADELVAALPDMPTTLRYNSPVTSMLALSLVPRSEVIAAYLLVQGAKPEIERRLDLRRRSLPTGGDINLTPEPVGMSATPLAPSR
jgi:hypothetical protein